MKRQDLRSGLRYSLYSLFSLSSLMLAFTISWCILAKVDFLYPVWHDLGGIGEGIDKYGPKNRYKPGFGDTDKSQRSRLFAEINAAVHRRDREALRRIRYQTQTSSGSQMLLRDSEVVHLVDVAHLIAILKGLAWVNTGVWLALCGLIAYLFRAAPSLKVQALALLSLFMAACFVLLVFGPVRVFNQFHIWVFPSDHQWFFYYQDSLMSTLMLAPTLFGWIAAALVCLALPSYTALCFLARFACSKRVRT